VSRSFTAVVFNLGSSLHRGVRKLSRGAASPYALYNIESLRPRKYSGYFTYLKSRFEQIKVTKWSCDREKVKSHWFTAICASLSKGVGMLALLRMRNNTFFYEEPVLSTAHEDVTAVLLPLTSLAVALFHRETNASSMSNRKLSGALYRKRKAKQEQ